MYLIYICTIMETNTPRSVQALLFAKEYPMGKLRVRQPFPSHYVDYPDPFILLHHADMKISEFFDPKNDGVGPHPHRGFSPVTFIFKGGVHHRDSFGNSSVVLEGGVQWMNAGRGIIHSERPPENIHDLGGRQEIIQLWVNMPAENKMDTPAYYPLSADEMAVIEDPNGKFIIRVVTGILGDKKGKIPTLSPVNSATIDAQAGAEVKVNLPIDHTAILYLLDGEIEIPGYGSAEMHHAIMFKNDGDSISFSVKKNTRMLLLSGLPLKEPMASHGPFVMNNETQLLEAMRDYQMGKMGILIEE